MGTHIHRAIGFGMPCEDFRDSCLIKWNDYDYIGDALDDRLGQYTDLQYGGTDYITRVTSPFVTRKNEHPGDLILVVGSGDEKTDIIIFPTSADMDSWHRFDDDADWVFAKKIDGVPETIVDYLPEMPLGWISSTRMDANGVSIPSPFESEDRQEYFDDPSLVQDIPPAMRWWLIYCGVLDLPGIAKLRPMRAQWWG